MINMIYVLFDIIWCFFLINVRKCVLLFNLQFKSMFIFYKNTLLIRFFYYLILVFLDLKIYSIRFILSYFIFLMSFNTKKAQSSRTKQILCANDKKAQTAKARETRRKNRIYRSASTSPVDNFRLDLNCKSAKNVLQHNILYELLHISQIKQKVSNYMIYPNIKQLSIGLFLISAAAFAYLKVFFSSS